MEVAEFVYQGYQIRTVTINSEPWFVAKDVCEVLELGDVSKAVSRVDEDEKGTNSIPTPGGIQNMLCVNEPGLYTLILGSRKTEAKAFKRWITHEVIPSIRKTGSYTMNGSIEDLIIMQAQSMKALRQEVESAKEQIAVAHHRIDCLDAVNVIGDMQQRLNAMVRKLAQHEGWTFQKAWREFTNSYNVAYRTNLTACIDNYKEKHGLKDLTRPQYLSITGHLEDAIRVADKMLNLESLYETNAAR